MEKVVMKLDAKIRNDEGKCYAGIVRLSRIVHVKKICLAEIQLSSRFYGNFTYKLLRIFIIICINM